MEGTSVLYISYTGLSDALGQSQVLPYLKGLSREGHRIALISCEKPKSYAVEKLQLQKQCATAGVEWYPLPYHKSPPVLSTWWDFRKMLSLAKRIVHQRNIDLIHCRGYLPSLVGRQLKLLSNTPFIFDMRGFWPDEKVESGAWKSPLYKPIYRFFKARERDFFRLSAYVISLTQVGKKAIIEEGWADEQKIGVIPTCVDFTVFPSPNKTIRDHTRKQLAIPEDAQVLVYSGSLGGNYDPATLFEVYKDFKACHSNPYLLILSKTSPDAIHDYMLTYHVDRKNIVITSSPFSKVHQYLMAADYGMIFYKPGYSNLGRCPTKLGEYWACGLPVLLQQGVGDLDYMAHQYPRHAALFTQAAKVSTKVWENLQSGSSAADKRAAAQEYFSLDKGIAFYNRAYHRIVNACE